MKVKSIHFGCADFLRLDEALVHAVLLLEKADIMQLRETLKLKYQIKICEIEIQEPVGSGENTISTNV